MFSSFLPVTFSVVVVVNLLYNIFRVGALYMHMFCIFGYLLGRGRINFKNKEMWTEDMR